MILNSSTAVVPWWNSNPMRCARRRRRRRVMMSSAENLRLQLDQLHFEAIHIRNKANNARLRLIRLSEAAEKLRQQAGISVQAGRENDARDLLYQKSKVLEAMDKSKARIQLLDDLSFKLNEAISAKETHLIQHVASDLDIVKNDASDTIRIVSPKDKDSNSNEDEILVKNAVEFNSNRELQTHENQPSQPVFTSANDFTSDSASSLQIESDTSTSLKGISSYEDFIAYIDEQLDKIEAELDTVLRVSTLVLEGDEKLKNLRVQQTLYILEGVRHIRERISKIMQKMTI